MEAAQKKIFVLDTNVLMHDPAAIFRFHEHDIYLPIVVLEELDAAKRGMSEVARNVREVSRFLNDLIEKADGDDLADGLKLPSHSPDFETGRLYFYMDAVQSPLPSLAPNLPDNILLGVTLDLDK